MVDVGVVKVYITHVLNCIPCMGHAACCCANLSLLFVVMRSVGRWLTGHISTPCSRALLEKVARPMSKLTLATQLARPKEAFCQYPLFFRTSLPLTLAAQDLWTLDLISDTTDLAFLLLVRRIYRVLPVTSAVASIRQVEGGIGDLANVVT